MTVVIPAFQAADHLDGALLSVLEQTPAAREVIVVDDGSTDGTAELLRRYGSEIRVITQRNGGEAAARNTGWRAATSDWVSFLDADDRFLPGRHAAIEAWLGDADPLDVSTTNGYLEQAGEVVGRCYGPLWTFATTGQRAEILRRNFVFGHVVISKRRLSELGGYDETITHTTDWALWIRHLLRGGHIDLIDDELSIYRIHARSQSADRLAMARGGLASLRSAIGERNLDDRGREILLSSIETHEALLDCESLVAGLEQGDRSTARAAAWRVIKEQAQGRRQRARAMATLLTPTLAAAAVRQRRKRWGVGTTGRRLRRTMGVGESGPVDWSTGPPPLASVILPFLDEERFLADAIESVQAQSLPLWELLLVDDGSTDDSATIAAEAAAAAPTTVRVLRHPDGGNHGLAASRNLGLSAARSGVIAFLDADDRWQPDKLKAQLRLLADHPDAGMVAGPTTHVSEIDGSRTVQPVTSRAPCQFACGGFAEEIVQERLLMPPPPSAVMYRRRALREVGGVPAGDSLYEDQRTFVAVSIAAPVLITADAPLSSYARRPDSLFGSLENDPATKAEQKRQFEWWVLRYCWRRGLVAWRVALRLVAHRLRHAVRRRRALRVLDAHR